MFLFFSDTTTLSKISKIEKLKSVKWRMKMIKLKHFKELIESIKIFNKQEELLADLVKPFNDSWTVIEFCPEIKSSIRNFLQEEFLDTDDWIGYFINDLNFGNDLTLMKDNKNSDGTLIDISTIEKLYEFLLKDNENTL
jgi:hypothetical protein